MHKFVTNIEQAVMQNKNFRTVLWTGCHLQLTLMCIPVGGEIGAEIHPDTDQFLRFESGNGVAMLGSGVDCVQTRCPVCSGTAVFVPAGTWHNVINTGNCPLKLYSLYAPPAHAPGTIHVTKAQADREEC